MSVENTVWGAVEDAVRTVVGVAVWSAMGGPSRGAVWGAVGSAVRTVVGVAVGDAVEDAVGEMIP